MRTAPGCLLAISSLLSACAGPASQVVIGERTQQHKEQIEQLTTPATDAAASAVSYTDRSWIALRKLERPAHDAGTERTDALQIEIHQRFDNLNDIAATVTALTGWPVLVAADVLATGTTAAPLSGASAGGLPLPLPPGPPITSTPRPPMLGPLPAGFPALAPSAVPAGPISASSAFQANYAGSLTGFMNLVAAYYGISWKLQAQALRFYLLESRTFRIAALPGDARLASGVDTGANTGAAAGGSMAAPGAGAATQSGASSNSTGLSFSGLSVWSAIESSVRQMLGPAGKVVASPATGTLTVTDTPAVLDKVAEYLEEQNRSLNRQVSVHVRVLSVELEEGETYGIQWDLVYARLTGGSPYAIALRTAAVTAEGVGNLVLGAPANSSSRWAGSQAMISALSTQGRVTELTSASVVTLNNQPVPVNVGRRVSYLAASATSQTANVGSTTSLTPGTVSTGFSMTLVPHIIDGQELLLQYAIDLSSLLAIKTISSGGSSIEAPDVSTSSFLQRVRLKSGETLVVAGFDQDNLSAVAQGVGHPENTLMGQRNGSSKRTMLVVLIQPLVAR